MTCTDIRDLIDGFVEGRLARADREAVERHIVGCAECRADVEAARFLQKPVAALPRAIDPSRDLWPRFERRLRPSPLRGRLLALAAALALVAGSSAVTWFVMRDSDGSAVAVTDSTRSAVQVFEARYVEQARTLGEVLESERGRLAPETVAVLERNLAIIDAAIAESRAALAADPSNPELETLLRAGHLQKVALLEQAARLVRES
jgi:anti-sigma factor RsiW